MQRHPRSSRPFWTLVPFVFALAGSVVACAGGTTNSGTTGGSTTTSTGAQGGGGSTSTGGSSGGGGATGGSSGGGGQTAGAGGAIGGGGSGGAVGGGGSGGGCAAEEKLCFNICVPADDPMFGCDDPSCTPCSDAHALSGCVAGACAILKCDAEWADCNGDASDGCEVHLPADPDNCGACGNACSIPHGTPGCEAGFCIVAGCDPTWSDCNGTVPDGCETNTKVDPANCSACSAACAPGEQCQDGMCGVFCDPGKANCDGDAVNGCEVDLGTVANCGFCGDSCDLEHASGDCQSSACVIVSCQAGYEDCDGVADNGCEANLQGSAATCGSCNNVCPSGPNSTAVCQAGVCDLVCAGGYADCNGDPNDGCEQPILTDPSNCGGCDSVCITPNGTPGCANGTCKISTCNPNFADCDSAVANGCEVNLQSDVDHCGACATACPTPANATPTCAAGACGYTCNAGFADCDGQAANGCEVNLNTDPSHCGSCAGACSLPNATAGCAAGACTVVACAVGFENCDGIPANGCEINTQTDTNHCGSCATICNLPNANNVCQGGMCAVSMCGAPFADCDGSAANGCEVNTDSSLQNCGACAQPCMVANGSPACAAGQCLVSSCNAGFANCNNLPADGCEINTNTSVANCGSCGNACNLANAVEACSGGACGIASCDAGFANCDNVTANGCEINTNTSVANCGSCGNACNLANASQSCVAGDCAIASCNAGFGNCDNTTANGCETNLNSSVQNCGTCGNACSFPNAGASCSNGSCAIGLCSAGFGNCDGNAANGCETNLQTSLANCGSCGNACNLANASEACTSGACAIAQCDAGFANCDNITANGCEINTNTNVGNCGSCGNVCNLPNAVEGCAAGGCTIASCNAGFGNCDGATPNGCETNLNSSVANCGSCGNACNLANASEACTNGACAVAQCDAGYTNCNNLPADGCEIHTAADVLNCGACGNACNLANASATCAAGACAIATCTAPFVDCDGSAANGCEINVQTNVLHCGACGNACNLANASATCAAGACAIASCNAGFADCDGNPANGCEVNILTSLGNCGACGSVCSPANATGTCTGGTCQVAACASGFANCNALPADGCEIDLQTSLGNCGGCGNACSLANASEACVSGLCTLSSCDPGFANCDNATPNGCEINTNTNVSNCGSCGNACNLANASQSCAGGACAIASCNAGFGNCDNTVPNGCETNLNSSVSNCGSCGNACTYANGTGTCTNGSCALASCTSGFANCDNSAANGCEINTNTNVSNCGSCGNACNLANASSTCSGGACAIASCAAPFANCDNLPANGCEINTFTNPSHCGGCGLACNLPNATPGCSGGTCVIAACNPGFADCDGNPANGCEINIATNVGNCGACGNICSPANATGSCAAGTCQVASCNSGYQNCNGLPFDGCEINTQTSVANCGGCGQICAPANSTGVCSAGLCTIGTCNSGYQNCNGTQADGCEINLQGDVQNCGTCGNNCAVTCSGHTNLTACVAGACGIQSCQTGYYNVDGACSGGCECQASNVSQACNTPQSLGTIAVGAAPITVSANLVPLGTEAWYTVTFTGNTNAAYHPRVRFTVNPGAAFQFDIRSNCAGGTLSCGTEGGVSNAITDWETFNGAGSPGYYDAIPPVGNNGTILIHVFRKSGQPLSCSSFTLQVSN